LSLLVASTLGIPAGVLSPHWQASLVVLAVQVVLAAFGVAAGADGVRVHALGVARRMVPGLLGALSVAWSTWLLGGHDLSLAATGLLRVLIIVFPSAVLVHHVDADALGDHLAQRLHLPARPVVALAAALQRVHTFGDIWTEISRARRVRGLGASARSPRSVLAEVWALSVGMLIRSLQAAAALAVAMDARGFATAAGRTWAEPAPWRRADTTLVLAAALPTIVAMVAHWA
jgi:energy-coupling factor transport system ATP-binding protein